MSDDIKTEVKSKLTYADLLFYLKSVSPELLAHEVSFFDKESKEYNPITSISIVESDRILYTGHIVLIR